MYVISPINDDAPTANKVALFFFIDVNSAAVIALAANPPRLQHNSMSN